MPFVPEADVIFIILTINKPALAVEADTISPKAVYYTNILEKSVWTEKAVSTFACKPCKNRVPWRIVSHIRALKIQIEDWHPDLRQLAFDSTLYWLHQLNYFIQFWIPHFEAHMKKEKCPPKHSGEGQIWKKALIETHESTDYRRRN